MESKSAFYRALLKGEMNTPPAAKPQPAKPKPTDQPAHCGGCSYRVSWEAANPCRSCGGCVSSQPSRPAAATATTAHNHEEEHEPSC